MQSSSRRHAVFPWRSALRRQWRNARVLFSQSRNSLLLFLLIIFDGATVFHFFYRHPETGQHPSFAKALHHCYALIFFEIVLPFPDESRFWYIQPLYFIIPILGLGVVVDGLVRFGNALFNKQSRGQNWQVAMASTFNHHIIICGLGKVGYRTALELLKFGRDVVAIDMNPAGRFIEAATEAGIPIILGDARRPETLKKAGLAQADAIVPVTDDELTNLDIALDARELKPGIKVVLRMFDPDLAERIERGFGIRTTYSTSALAAPIFATAALNVDVKHSFYVGETLVNLSELIIATGATITGWTVAELRAKLDLSVVYYQGKTMTDLHPEPQLKLCSGDKILVLAALPVLQELEKLNRPL
jgi:voltage-gated potassium channel